MEIMGIGLEASDAMAPYVRGRKGEKVGAI
jgi:hypothetical protein